MKKYTNIFENVLISLGISVSLVDIQNVLSIVLLVFELLWVAAKILIKLKSYLKDGVLDEKEKSDLKEDIEQLEKQGKVLVELSKKEGDK